MANHLLGSHHGADRRAHFSVRYGGAFVGVALALLLSVSGCTGMLIGNALQQGQQLTPEQIKAYNEIGSVVYGCFQIGGPPPAGNTQWVVVPKGTTILPKFGDNCHIIQ